MSEVSVRPAEPRDVPGIRDVAERAWHAAYDDVLDPDTIESALNAWYGGGALLEAIRDADAAFFVAETAGNVVGYVSGATVDDPTLGEVGAIYVDPDRWRTGIGRRLLARFEAHARDQGWDAVRIRVLTANQGARKFYEAHGYRVVAKGVVSLFGEDTPEVFYRRRLD